MMIGDRSVQPDRGVSAQYVSRLGNLVDRRRTDIALRAALMNAQDAARTAQMALIDAQSANAAKTQFLANVSHELRTPMNAIIGFAEILGSIDGPGHKVQKSPERSAEYASYILQAGHHLLAIINDLLDTAKIESGAFDLNEDHVDLRELADACNQVIAQLAADKNLNLKFSISPNLPSLWADIKRLEQILINLLSNAIKFTHEGGNVEMSAHQRSDGGLDVRVKDTGIGIHSSDIEKALTPFRQVEHHLNRNYEGTGLGLALAKSLTELHGGTLRIESELDVGTVVTVSFPESRTRHSPDNGRS